MYFRGTIFFSLLFIYFGFSCTRESQNDFIPKSRDLRYLALGDSYTIGQGVPENERWPVLLADSLTKSGIKMDNPRIIARTGWTTSDLESAIFEVYPEESFNEGYFDDSFDLVSLLIGVNNQYRGISEGYVLDNYRKEFAGLLQLAIDFAKGDTGRVFVVSIPDYSVTPFVSENFKVRISDEIDQYNEINREIAAEFNVKYFNITPVSRLAAADKQLLAADQLHPSGRMYRLWVDLMIDDIIKML